MILPKLELLALPFGLAKWGVLLRLNDSASELQVEPLRQLECAEKAQVHIHHAGSPHRVPADSAEPDTGRTGERCGVEPCAVVADQAQRRDTGFDLIGRLGVAGHVERGPGCAQRILPPLVCGENSIELPIGEYRLGDPGVGELLIGAEWNLIQVSELEHVRNVVRRRGAVAVEDTGGVPTEGRPVAIVGHVDRMRISVGAFQEQSSRDSPVDRDLE